MFYFTLPLQIPEVENDEDSGQKTILAIDDDSQVLELYERYLSEHGYRVIPLTDPFQAVEQVQKLQPFAVLLDTAMPGKDGWQVLKELKSRVDTRHIPVILCTIQENQKQGFSLGAADYLMKPILEEDLALALERLNGDGRIQEVLVVDDDPEDLRVVEKILLSSSQDRSAQSSHPYHVRLAQGGAEGLVALRTRRPHIVILDLFMPGLDGFTLLETMRADPAYMDIPVIIFTGGDLTDEQKRSLTQFSVSGADLLNKRLVDEKQLLDRIEKALKRPKQSNAPTIF
jgi:CheY-like chemotaxis protein